MGNASFLAQSFILEGFSYRPTKPWLRLFQSVSSLPYERGTNKQKRKGGVAAKSLWLRNIQVTVTGRSNFQFSLISDLHLAVLLSQQAPSSEHHRLRRQAPHHPNTFVGRITACVTALCILVKSTNTPSAKLFSLEKAQSYFGDRHLRQPTSTN